MLLLLVAVPLAAVPLANSVLLLVAAMDVEAAPSLALHASGGACRDSRSTTAGTWPVPVPSLQQEPRAF